MLVFRFANRFVEPVLRADHVDEIQITVAETLGVEGRSRYYDGIGAAPRHDPEPPRADDDLRDDGTPALWDAEMIRDHKVEVLKAIRAVDPRPIRCAVSTPAGLVDGEPRIGYRGRARCRSESRTDTFAALRLYLDSWRWEGVPMLLRSGKRLGAKAHEVAFRFKEPPTRFVPAHAARALDPTGSCSG